MFTMRLTVAKRSNVDARWSIPTISYYVPRRRGVDQSDILVRQRHCP
jgi:hypothetical protein